MFNLGHLYLGCFWYGEPMRIKNFMMWIAAVLIQIFVFSGLANAQTPALVHSKSLSSTSEQGNNFKIQYGGSMGTGTLAGNLLTLRMTYPHGATVSSISDNQSSTYTLGASADSGSGGWVTALYYVPGAAAGITQITVSFSASVVDWHAAVQEYSGVAANSPQDGTCSSSTATPATVECSSAIVTGTSGDLIVASTMLVGGLGSTLCGNTSSSMAAGGSFILDAADPYCSDADEEYVQPSTGSITPSFSIAGNSRAFNIVAMAFMPSAGAGTIPVGMYILHQQTVQVDEGTSSQTNYFVSSGNLLVTSVDDGNTNSGGNVVTIDSCTPSVTWTKRSPSGFDMPQMFFVPSASTSTSLHCTVHSGQPGDTTLIVIYDIVGAASSPEDTNSTGVFGSGSVVGNAPNLTPTTQPGIAFAVENTGTGPSSGVGAGYIFDNTPYTSETDQGRLNNGDGWQHIFYTTTSPLTFSWNQVIASSTIQAFAIAFKAGTTGPPPPPSAGITISPESDSINLSSTLQFAATVTGVTDTSLTWSATCGTVSSSGLFQAPSSASSCTVTATSVANPSLSASASVTAADAAPPPPPTIMITISPASGSINVNSRLQFTATVTGSSNTTVVWSRTCGTINFRGMYRAPSTASSCTVTGTSLVNPAVSASAIVTVMEPPPPTIVITISPASGSLDVNSTLQFTASVTGSTNTTVAWSRTCGTIDSSGLYTAPATPSSCTVTATSLANPADSASASVTVGGAPPPPPNPAIGITISPASYSISINSTLQFTATVTGSTNTTVVWSGTCGTINPGGLYTAPASPASCTVTATSLANPAFLASANVTVGVGPRHRRNR